MVYKRKRGSDRKVETFKARLVAKGFTQKEATFSPVAMLKSIRILLSIVACLDYEIWQMDVNTTFLNGNLEEDIYMQQPEGFVAGRKDNLVCKLQNSIHGLKRLPGVGTFSLIKRLNCLVSLRIRMRLAYTRNHRVR